MTGSNSNSKLWQYNQTQQYVALSGKPQANKNRVSDCCLMPTLQFFSYFLDDEVHFVLDKQEETRPATKLWQVCKKNC
jgi:hypothetical protein